MPSTDCTESVAYCVSPARLGRWKQACFGIWVAFPGLSPRESGRLRDQIPEANESPFTPTVNVDGAVRAAVSCSIE